MFKIKSKTIRTIGLIILSVVILQFATPFIASANNPASTTNEETNITSGSSAPPIPNISTLPGPQSTNLEDISAETRNRLLPSIAVFVIQVASAISVLFIIIGSIQYIFAVGDETKFGNAKKTVIFAAVGLIISLLSYAIVSLIFYTAYQVPLGAGIPTAYAQSVDDVLPPLFDTIDEDNPVTTDYINALPGAEEDITWQRALGRIIYYLLIVVNFLTVGSFVTAGVIMIISQDDENMITKAKKIFYYTILAAIFAAVALGVVRAILELDYFAA